MLVYFMSVQRWALSGKSTKLAPLGYHMVNL